MKLNILILGITSLFSNTVFASCNNLDNTVIPNLADGSSCDGTGDYCSTFVCEENYVATGEVGCFGFADVWYTNTAACTYVDPDPDSDGIDNQNDNCPNDYNPLQEDFENDGIGNVCDDDHDNDGYWNDTDNCPYISQINQYDQDNDGEGDICDSDIDGDGVPNDLDWYDYTAELSGDHDGDGIDSRVDPDKDGDGYDDITEKACGSSDWDRFSVPPDMDQDSVCDAMDSDIDGDYLPNFIDANPLDAANTNELDLPINGTYQGIKSERIAR